MHMGEVVIMHAVAQFWRTGLMHMHEVVIMHAVAMSTVLADRINAHA